MYSNGLYEICTTSNAPSGNCKNKESNSGKNPWISKNNCADIGLTDIGVTDSNLNY